MTRSSHTMPAACDEEAMRLAHALLDAYQHRIVRAALSVPALEVGSLRGRGQVRQHLQRCLGVRDEWIPRVSAQAVRQADHGAFTIQWLAGSSWPGVRSTALLYLPLRPAGAQSPFVLLCCGHGKTGKFHGTYQQMAQALARRGSTVLCPDNLGQGERAAMGHGDVVGPFACGTSVQGLILMETLGWLNWARTHLTLDLQRIAAIGNSGGGLLTQLLIPFDDGLAAICSTGYPSSYAFIAAKEKKHCHCNLLPGIVPLLEMHHVYGCFAPRPLLLMQGRNDQFFPPDLFHLTARRTAAVYQQCGHPEHLSAVVTVGAHPWDQDRLDRIAAFLTEHLGLRDEYADEPEHLLDPSQTCFHTWPADALTTDALASALTGRRLPADLNLWDVYPPQGGADLVAAPVTERGDLRQILAQMESFLHQPGG